MDTPQTFTPILPGIVKGNDLIRFCQYFRKTHLHGYPDQTRPPEHRAAHCYKDDFPYLTTGYIIEVKEGGDANG